MPDKSDVVLLFTIEGLVDPIPLSAPEAWDLVKWIRDVPTVPVKYPLASRILTAVDQGGGTIPLSPKDGAILRSTELMNVDRSQPLTGLARLAIVLARLAADADVEPES